MIVSTEHKSYKSLMKKGKGSILKAMRTNKGGGKGLIAVAIILLVFTLPFSIIGILAGVGPSSVSVSVLGLLLLVLGIVLKRRRDTSWLSYYQDKTGFSEGELQQLDRELAFPSVTLVFSRTPSAAVDNRIACFLTEHYMVMDGVEPYVCRLEDIIAVAFSDSTDNWRLAILTTQDKETKGVGLFTDTWKKEALCREIMQQLCDHNPKILCGQEILCEGRHYILERDGAELLRLYKEGHTLESTK